LHAEILVKNELENKIYFAHQIHNPENLFQSLSEYEGITIETTNI